MSRRSATMTLDPIVIHSYAYLLMPPSHRMPGATAVLVGPTT